MHCFVLFKCTWYPPALGSQGNALGFKFFPTSAFNALGSQGNALGFKFFPTRFAMADQGYASLKTCEWVARHTSHSPVDFPVLSGLPPLRIPEEILRACIKGILSCETDEE
jgi:hypothetical protein